MIVFGDGDDWECIQNRSDIVALGTLWLGHFNAAGGSAVDRAGERLGRIIDELVRHVLAINRM